jgi:hypothetical protein
VEREFAERGIAIAFNEDIDTPEQYERAKSLLSENEEA